MMNTLVISVKLDALVKISDKCYKALAFDGSEALIPMSQYYGIDTEMSTEEVTAHWISAWILGKVDLQYSDKRKAFVNKESREIKLASGSVVYHEPKPLKAEKVMADESLVR